MPFAKGNQLAKGKHHKRTANGPKTLWLLQSLQANGVNLQDLLAKSILKAAKGDRQATELAALLTKLLPYVANAPKNDVSINSIDTLVINRYDKDKLVQPVERASTDGWSPSIDTEVVDISLPSKEI